MSCGTSEDIRKVTDGDVATTDENENKWCVSCLIRRLSNGASERTGTPCCTGPRSCLMFQECKRSSRSALPALWSSSTRLTVIRWPCRRSSFRKTSPRDTVVPEGQGGCLGHGARAQRVSYALSAKSEPRLRSYASKMFQRILKESDHAYRSYIQPLIVWWFAGGRWNDKEHHREQQSPTA